MDHKLIQLEARFSEVQSKKDRMETTMKLFPRDVEKTCKRRKDLIVQMG